MIQKYCEIRCPVFDRYCNRKCEHVSKCKTRKQLLEIRKNKK